VYKKHGQVHTSGARHAATATDRTRRQLLFSADEKSTVRHGLDESNAAVDVEILGSYWCQYLLPSRYAGAR
jgi:hypothetical protein